MSSQLLRASRSTLARLARRQPVPIIARRAFIAAPIRHAELVQDMYLRELKNYKQPALRAADSEGQVQRFAMPKAPPSPEEADIAAELKAYEEQQVEVEGQQQGGEGGGAVVEQDWYEEEEDEEGEAAGAAH